MVKTIWAKAQQPITLPCDLRIPPNGNYELEWRKDGSLIFNAYGNDPGFTVAELQGKSRFSHLYFYKHFRELFYSLSIHPYSLKKTFYHTFLKKKTEKTFKQLFCKIPVFNLFVDNF